MADNDFRYTIPAEHLPATIIAVKTSKDKSMSDGDELLEYEYIVKREGYVDDDKTALIAQRGEIRATKDGVVEAIHVAKGKVIDNESTVVIDYKGCDHDTQYEGMCVMCCKTVPMNQESHVMMAHDATSLAVSRSEAKRLEHDTVGRLLNEGKLSLIVDLDQTLIHATVGPAIDEWINSQGGMPQDVKMFPLPDSSTPYYIKLRPHLERFLQKVAAIYELHIYTMGTRNYASAVAKAIDPDGKFFSQRILSRDENLNMTQKSIERLFPCDTSMVVVIDDRADVWQYSPNLVKVHPYEYFVGAGDINAGHLPKQDTVVKSEPTPSTGAAPITDLVKESTEAKSELSDTSAGATETTVETEASTAAPTDATAVPADATTASSRATSEEKTPEEKSEEKKVEVTASTVSAPGNPGKVLKPKAPVMDDNDNELKHILEILETIHEKFYDDREVFKLTKPKKQPDVKEIIRDMKKSVLKGVNIVFSSVIPLGQIPQRADIWRQAESFGAICSTELSAGVTHIVAAKAGTQKVSEARRRRNVRIVRPEWLYHSIGKWQRQNEADYILPELANKSSPRSTTPPHNPEDEKNVGGAEGNGEEDQGGESEDMGTIQTINNNVWEDVAKELEDELGDLDDTDFDSDTSTHSNTQSDASTDRGNRSPLTNLKRTRVFRRSGLSTAVTSGGNDDDDDEDEDSDNGRMNVDMMEGGDGREGFGEDDDDDKGMSTQDSDSDIDDENGSDSQQGYSDATSDASGSAVRRRKRRRRSIGKNGGLEDTVGNDDDDDEDGMDADDEVTMDHTHTMQQSQEDDDDDDDVDFLNDLENDLDAQLKDD
ncbi:Carboxy-terminal domain (CTD) phosphatase [Mortierella hygrophila]|uniref:RNA polymerase II subunit A C-terminal domain phosphatase n=1 Tax=Mortierella hygrophila TaxID=979708 RepID=A0A9P6F8A1_9FUNG|nr:Carboxy-terminal domain (CTD) phosphatase [Mortierella hygrophila]